MTLSTPQRLFACAAAVSIAAFTLPGFAGEITTMSWSSGVASVASQSVATDTLNNDDHDPDTDGVNDNVLSILQKDYFAIGPVDILVNVVNSGGTTEYVVVEQVQNSSPIDWDGYHIELGFDSGSGFTKSTAGDGLDFDYDPVPSSSYNSPVNFAPGPVFHTTITRPTEDDLVASGDIQDAGEYSGLSFVFHIDVPDGISQFTIRQSPLPVPEPGSAALLLLAVGLTMRRKRR